MIEAIGLGKRYEPSGVDALADVSFSVAAGEVFGFLGRNGAGKSTTVRILTTLLQPTTGTARVGGHDVIDEPSQVRQILGAALQEAALDELMTGREHLVLAGRLVGLPKPTAAGRADELLTTFGLVAAADRVAATYSGGMRRRLDVAMAMVRRPPVLFLDEPTTGLDPQGRRALWQLVADLRQEGTAVFLTTQYLAEADELSDRVAIVHDGRIAATGTPQELKDQVDTTTVRMQVSGATRAPAASLLDTPPTADGFVVLKVTGEASTVPALIARLNAAGVEIERLAIMPPTLEDVFVKLTGEEIEASAGLGESSSLSAVRRGLGRS
ncbi:MAG: ATP-binding cassette domain-containing protein [Acidimicrobiales bacterium]